MLKIPFEGSVLVHGGAGKGKTSLLRAMIREVLDGEVSVIAVSGELQSEVDTGRGQRVTRLDQASHEIERIYTLFSERNRQPYEAEERTEKAIFVLIDEAPRVLRDLSEETMGHLKECITLGPTVNIQVVVAGQRFPKAFASLFHVTADVDRRHIEYRSHVTTA